jgi:hypothetical protein
MFDRLQASAHPKRMTAPLLTLIITLGIDFHPCLLRDEKQTSQSETDSNPAPGQGSFDGIANSITQMFDFIKPRNEGHLFLNPSTGEEE